MLFLDPLKPRNSIAKPKTSTARTAIQIIYRGR